MASPRVVWVKSGSCPDPVINEAVEISPAVVQTRPKDSLPRKRYATLHHSVPNVHIRRIRHMECVAKGLPVCPLFGGGCPSQ